MLLSKQLVKAWWTLADQAVVSLGTFLVNVILARHLLPQDYGLFALVFGVLLTLQIFNASLLFYPLSVRRAVSSEERRKLLMGAGVVLTVILCLPLNLMVAAILIALNRYDLLIPVVIHFTVWQLQEAARRGMLAEFRHRSAILGDALGYVGQVIVLLALSMNDMLTLENAFYAMAVMLTFAGMIQFRQIVMSLPRPREIREVFNDFWAIGSWSLANNLVATMRIQIFPWMLALLFGPAAVAPFQASLNVANAANPVVIGLCNVIPQTAALARDRGNRHAWLASRPYVWMGVPPAFAYSALVLLMPQTLLEIMYGASSPYLENLSPVRVLILSWLLSYAADMLCSYLHGIDAPRTALIINGFGVAIAFLLAVPLIMAFGLVGSCVALLIASAARLAISQILLVRIFANERPQPA